MVLQKMRGGAGAGVMKAVLLGFLVMAVAGLVLMDVQGFFRGGLSTDIVAKGGGVRISTQEFDRQVRRILAAQGLSPEQAYKLGLINQILNGEIQARLLTNEARDLGLFISDDLIREQIERMAAPLAQGGASKAQALQRILQAQGISEGEFISGIRQEMAIGLLRNALVSGSNNVSDDLARALYQSEKETRAIEAVVFTPASVEGVSQPSEQQLKTYYDANKMEYAIPETRSATLAFINKATVEDDAKLTEEDLRAAYEENIAAYRKPAQREIEQSVFADEAKAKAALEAYKKSKSLKDATGENNGYTGKSTFQQSGMLPEIAGPVFEGKAGDVVGPIQTDLGWHVIVIGKDIAEETTPFEKVRGAIEKELEQTHIYDVMVERVNEIDDRLAGGEDIDALVKEYGLTTQKISSFRQTGFNGANKNLFEFLGTDSGPVLDAIFSVEAGETAPVMELSDGRFIMARVDDVTPIAYKSFDDVKAGLKEKWLTEQRALLNRARAQDALKQADGGKALKDLGKAQTYNSVKRADAGTKSITPVALAKIFSVDKGEVLLAESGNDIVLVRVTGITVPTAGNVPADALKEIKDRVARENAEEILTQYINNRSAHNPVKINQALLEQLYAGGDQG